MFLPGDMGGSEGKEGMEVVTGLGWAQRHGRNTWRGKERKEGEREKRENLAIAELRMR